MNTSNRKKQTVLIALMVLTPLLYLSFVIGKPLLNAREATGKAGEIFRNTERDLSLPSPDSYTLAKPHSEWSIPLMSGASWSHDEPGRVVAAYTLPHVDEQTIIEHGNMLADAGWLENTENGEKRKSQTPKDFIQEEKVSKENHINKLQLQGGSKYCLANIQCQKTNDKLLEDAKNKPISILTSYRRDAYQMLMSYSFRDNEQQTFYTNVKINLTLIY